MEHPRPKTKTTVHTDLLLFDETFSSNILRDFDLMNSTRMPFENLPWPSPVYQTHSPMILSPFSAEFINWDACLPEPMSSGPRLTPLSASSISSSTKSMQMVLSPASTEFVSIWNHVVSHRECKPNWSGTELKPQTDLKCPEISERSEQQVIQKSERSEQQVIQKSKRPDQQVVQKTEKPFQCTFDNCTTLFGSRSALYRHMRSHKGIVKYECEHCLKTFLRKDDYRRHQQSRHRLGSCRMRPGRATLAEGKI